MKNVFTFDNGITTKWSAKKKEMKKSLKVLIALVAVPFATVSAVALFALLADIVISGIGQYESIVTCPLGYIVFGLTFLFGFLSLTEND